MINDHFPQKLKSLKVSDNPAIGFEGIKNLRLLSLDTLMVDGCNIGDEGIMFLS